jgi:hypothetical protein
MTHRIRLFATAATLTTVFAANSAFAWAPAPGPRGHESDTSQHQNCSCKHHAQKDAPRAGRAGTWRA